MSRIAVIGLACFLCFVPCIMAQRGIIPATLVQAEEQWLGEWLIFGPYDTKDNSLDVTCLKEGAVDGHADIRRLEGIVSQLPRASEGYKAVDAGPCYTITSRVEAVDFHRRLGFERPQEDNFEVFFAVCTVQSEVKRTVYVLLGHDDRLSLWVNGHEVYRSMEHRSVEPPLYITPITLEAGANLILAKVQNGRAGCGFSMRLFMEQHAAILSAAQDHDFLNDKLVLEKSRPVFSFPSGLASPKFRLAVSKDGTTILPWQDVTDKTAFGPSDGFPPGVFQVNIAYGNSEFFRTFVSGDPQAVFDSYKSQVAAFREVDRTAINLDTLIRRLEILLAPQNRKEADTAWRWKTKYTFDELDAAISRLKKGQEAFAHVPGLHLRGFRSRIDDAVQHYRIFVPDSYQKDGAGMPLMVMLPTVTSASRPFIESVFVADHERAHRAGRIASKVGAMLVWNGFRCQPGGNPCEFTHLDEVLAEVSRDYKVDANRVVLLGACSGGILAGMSAVQFPNRFAGIGILNGIFHRSARRPQELDIFSFSTEYDKWMLRSDPVEPTLRLANMPIYVTNDGTREWGHGPLELTLDYVSKARSLRANIEFEPTPQDGYGIGPWLELISWGVAQRRQESSPRQESGMYAGHAEHGPIARVLADRFLLVFGTGGSTEEQAAITGWKNEFARKWKSTHYGPCRVLADTELSSSEEMMSNLVLLGNERTNSVWQRLNAAIPLRMDSKGIELNGKRWKGDALGIQAAFPHPQHAMRRIVVIGSANVLEATFGTMDLSVDGWYDYAIWRPDDEDPLVAAGFF